MVSGERGKLLGESWAALKGATWAVFGRLHDEMREDGTTPAQHGFLHVIMDAEQPLTPREIAKLVDVTPATVSGMLNKLEDAGLIERVRQSTDRRVLHVRITPAGVAAIEERRARFRVQLAKVFEPMSDAELRTITGLLARVAPPIIGPPGGFASLIRHDVHHAKPSRKPAARKPAARKASSKKRR